EPTAKSEREFGDPPLESGVADAPQGLTTIGGKGMYLTLFSQIGVMLLVATLGGALGGDWLDGKLGSRPFGLVFGFIGGFLVGSVGSAQLIRRVLATLDALESAEVARRQRARIDAERGRAK
ncbi:MAG: AtpZ/AtpI family protein, partial [bacterium]